MKTISQRSFVTRGFFPKDINSLCNCELKTRVSVFGQCFYDVTKENLHISRTGLFQKNCGKPFCAKAFWK